MIARYPDARRPGETECQPCRLTAVRSERTGATLKITMSAIMGAMSGNVNSFVLAAHGSKGNYHTRKVQTHKEKIDDGGLRCDCWAFKFCDLAYQSFSDEEKAQWRDAIKKQGMSAYDLWMKECLTLVNSGENPPDEPSVSGGWSTASVAAGTTRPLPPGNPCRPDIPIGEPCDLCSGDAPRYVKITFAGFGEPVTMWNDSFVLDQLALFPCGWRFENEFGIINARLFGLGWRNVGINANPAGGEGEANFANDSTVQNCLLPCTSWTNYDFTSEFEPYEETATCSWEASDADGNT